MVPGHCWKRTFSFGKFRRWDDLRCGGSYFWFDIHFKTILPFYATCKPLSPILCLAVVLLSYIINISWKIIPLVRYNIHINSRAHQSFLVLISYDKRRFHCHWDWHIFGSFQEEPLIFNPQLKSFSWDPGRSSRLSRMRCLHYHWPYSPVKLK